MHSVVKHINKKQIPICKHCIIKAIQKSKEEVTEMDDEICSSITRTQTLEDETIIRLHKLNSIMEESNLI